MLQYCRIYYMINWLILILSLPTENATARMRAWRALKSSGAAVLRDGVYLLPESDVCQMALNAAAADVRSGGGTAYLLRVSGEESLNFHDLFDRSADYAALLMDIKQLGDTLTAANAVINQKQVRKLRKTFASLAVIDFFAGEAQKQTEAALQALEAQSLQLLTPGEPHSVAGVIPRLDPNEYHGRVWATRQRPWVDRLASAWLIRRYIDPDARILWLASATDCPADALSFDFDGAIFSHVGAKVTFEVLLASFGLKQPSLQRLGALVHFLDVGGIQPDEAHGIERVLAGLRASMANDDDLLQAASSLFEGLQIAFEQEVSAL